MVLTLGPAAAHLVVVSSDVVVVGAGLSGLVCARRLAAAGLEVDVVEARERVGGRTLSRTIDGLTADLGGEWIAPSQQRVIALAVELGVETTAQFRTGEAVLARRERRGLLARLPFHLVELLYRVRQLERMSRRVPADAPASAPLAGQWDALTVGDWLGRRVRTREARDMLGVITELKFAAPPERLSLLFFLHYLATSGGLIDGARFASGSHEERLRGGADQLCKRLAATLPEPVHLSEPVLAIAQERDMVVARSERGEYRAPYLVVALAPNLAARIAITPPLPPDRRQIEEASRPGAVIKCFVTYARAFWRDLGLSGEAYTVTGRLRAVVDGCGDERAALIAFIVGEEAERLSGQTREVRRDLVVAELVELFGPAAADSTGYDDVDWLGEEWSSGALSVVGPGVLAPHGAALRAPVGRIHYAGTESAVEWPSHLEGAVEAGERAAAEIIARAVT